MNDIEYLIGALTSGDDKTAYDCLEKLVSKSGESNSVYRYFDTFAAMLDSSKSYVRTRGLVLISANAKWDKDRKTEALIDRYLCHITDEKPITARSCIRALPEIAEHKPHLIPIILDALCCADTGKYKESMRHLIADDITKASEIIKNIQSKHE